MTAKSGAESGIYRTVFNLTVLVAGLGYFIDTFDFFLYNSMRTVSLTELGLSGDELTRAGIIILNASILGALLGSFFWGILGDRLGRKKPLLGSILLYSVGMIANGFVHDVIWYGVIRFIVGFGLAGEIGLGATLVAETIQSSKRTYALMFFTVMGVLGVGVAGTSVEWINWRISCFLGGGLGLTLLLLRGALFESALFTTVKRAHHRRGSLRDLFGKAKNLKKYLLCVPLLGTNFFVTVLLLTLSPEVAKATGVQGVARANIALAIYFTAAALGDLMGAWLSERLKSRKWVIALFMLGNLSLAFLFLQKNNLPLPAFYAFCGAFGLFNLWAICGTVVVELFPTELRATAATSNFNCSRAMGIFMNWSFLSLRFLGTTQAICLTGAAVFALGLFCLWRIPESYGHSLEER